MDLAIRSKHFLSWLASWRRYQLPGSVRFYYPGATPTISADSSANGIVWVVMNSAPKTSLAVLFAYDATNLANELYDSNQARGP